MKNGRMVEGMRWFNEVSAERVFGTYTFQKQLE